MSKKETRNLTRCNIISGGDTRHWNGDKTEHDDRGFGITPDMWWKCDETAPRLEFYQDRWHGSLIDRSAWRWDENE